MVDTRTVTLPAIWADDAITEIPTPPIANTTYRNTDLGSTELLQGWPYQKIVDSADFNQTLWLISNLIKTSEQYGIMPWCASTTYKQNGICLASNGIFYWAKQDNTGVNPVTDSGMTNWGVFLDPGDNFVTETVLTSQIDLCEKLANKTQTLSSSSTTTQYPSAKAVYDNINNLQNSKQNNITGGASSITTSNLTANRALISNGSGKVAVANVTSTELGYLDGVTSGIQAQLNGKQATITGGASTITGSNLTANRALISNGSGKVAVANVTSTELGYLDGVTSAIQTQINNRLTQSQVDSRITSIMNSKQLPELTQLYLNTSGLDTGDVPLSQPFTNFPYVLIGLSNDIFSFITYQMFNSAILDWFLKGNLGDKPFLFDAGGSSTQSPGVWQIKNYAHGSSTTLWVHDYDTVRLVCVYGVSF